jgi:hypothetical protein
VLLDDREQVGEELSLEVGEIGVLDRREVRDLVLDRVDRLALGGRLGRAARLARGLGAVRLGLLGRAGLGLQAAR